MKTIIAKRRIKSGARTFQPGETVPENFEGLEELISLDVVEIQEELQQVSETSSVPTNIVEAIVKILPAMPKDEFNKDGSPNVKAVESALKDRFTSKEITAALVAEAWKKYQADQQSRGDKNT